MCHNMESPAICFQAVLIDGPLTETAYILLSLMPDNLSPPI